MKIMTRRKISTEFKIESASLVLDQGYTISEACDAVGIGDTAMRRWVNQLRNERQGITPVGSKALTPDQQKIQELETKIKRIEMEKEILKKATALLMSDTMRSSY
jgi:transposase